MKICPVFAELFHANGKLDGWTNMTRLIVTFHSFVNDCCSQ